MLECMFCWTKAETMNSALIRIGQTGYTRFYCHRCKPAFDLVLEAQDKRLLVLAIDGLAVRKKSRR